MSNKLDPVFKLSNLTAEQLLLVEIDEASEGRSFGRRFKVNAGVSGSSEALLFRDILDEVKDIAKTAKKNGDLKKFEAVSKLLVTLNTADDDANLIYEGKGWGYRSLTFISRLFRQAHFKRIDKLHKSVSKNIDAFDPMKRLADLKNSPDSPKKNQDLAKLAQEFFDNKDYDHCLEAIDNQSINGKAWDLIVETAKCYLTNDEPKKAIETIKLIKTGYPKKYPLIAKVADYYFIEEKFDKVIETIKLFSDIRDKANFIGKMADFYIKEKEYDKAVETLNLVDATYLPSNLTKRILDQYIEDKKYEKALELLPNYRSSKLDYALKLGNQFCDDNDFENAHKAIKLIHKQGHLHPNEKKASEALIKRLVTHYCEGENKQPEKALEIVEPMFVASQCLKDLSTKNALLKEIAEAYIAIGQMDEALTTHDKILPKFELDNAFFMKAAEAYFAKNEPQRALLTIGKCGGLQFRDGVEMLKQKYQAAINQ